MNIQTCPKCGKKSYRNTAKKEVTNVTTAEFVDINFATKLKFLVG
jgi:hypothetical protein